MPRRTLTALAAAVLLTLTAACGPTGGNLPPADTTPAGPDLDFVVEVVGIDGLPKPGVGYEYTLTAISTSDPDHPVDMDNPGSGQHSTQTVSGENVTPNPVKITVARGTGSISATFTVALELDERLTCWVEIDGLRLAGSVSDTVMTEVDADPILPATPADVTCYWASA